MPPPRHLTRMVFRPRATANRPMSVRSVGIHESHSGFAESHPARGFWQLFWCVRGSGSLTLEQTEHTLQPGDIFLCGPADPHHMRGQPGWECHWLTIDGPQAEATIATCDLFDHQVRSVGPCPTDLFTTLASILVDPRPEAESKAAGIAYEILLHACSGTAASSSDLAQQVHKLIETHFTDPMFDVAELARQLDIHRSHLTRTYSKQIGISPIDSLQARRLQEAIHLLTTSTLPIAVVASQVGYNDSGYFARMVKKITGRSPRQIRQGQ